MGNQDVLTSFDTLILIRLSSWGSLTKDGLFHDTPGALMLAAYRGNIDFETISDNFHKLLKIIYVFLIMNFMELVYAI